MRVSMQMCTWPQVTCHTPLVLWEELQVYNQKPCLPLRTQESQEMLRPSARGCGVEKEAKREGHCLEPGTQRTPHKQLFRKKWRRSHPQDNIYWSEKVGEHDLLWQKYLLLFQENESAEIMRIMLSSNKVSPLTLPSLE